METDSREPVTVSRLRRWAMRLLVLISMSALGLMVVEAALWLVAPVPFHEWMVWESEGHIRARPMPNQVIHTAKGHPVRINKDGFRGPDYRYEKEPGTLRIAVFGGSAGFCYHASNDEATWPVIVEKKLEAELDMPVEVINLALPGFDVFHSKINYLCFGRAFEPDAIIVYHTWNDMKSFRSQEERPYRSLRWVPNKPLWERIARETQLGRHGRNAYWRATKRQMENKYRTDDELQENIAQPVSDKAIAWERTNFEDFAAFANRDGVLPILVSQATLVTPEVLGSGDREVQLALAPSVEMVGMSLPLIAETWEQVSELIRQVAHEHDAVFVDGYNAVPHDLEHLEDSVHLTDLGSAVLGREISRVLLADSRFRALVARVREETALAGAASR